MIDVLAVGEILIDFTQNGLSGQGNKMFEANPGGAPANVLAALNKYGKRCALVAKVGDDGFGRTLISALEASGIDSSFVAVDGNALTTLAFVQTFEGGEREFSFYRDRTADVMLSNEDIPLEALKESKIIHFGSVSLSSEPARSAVHYMIEEAFRMGKFISFDPNYRPFLWSDSEEAKTEVLWGISKSTLLKILSGSIKPDSGSLVYDGADPLKNVKIFERLIGYVPQENPLMTQLSVMDNLKFWYCDSSRSLKNDLINGAPAMLGISAYADKRVDRLSGGQKKRLSIACALAKQPPVLIMDEPGASLDIVCKEDIKNYLQRYMQSGGTVILTSHEQTELELCSRMYLLKNGTMHELDGHPGAAELKSVIMGL